MTANQTTGVHVLVIDDDATTRETFQHMLRAEGYAVHAESSVESGLASAAERTPDVILLDLHMPLAGGLECLRRLRANAECAGIPVAIVTGDYFIDDVTATELRERGARIYFKPVWEEDLRRIVHESLSRRAARIH
jgi:CheY-like chemotaxis protein